MARYGRAVVSVAYAIFAFLTSKLVNSQAAAIAIVMPLALNVGMDPVLIMSFISACYGYFFLPTYPSDLACIGFDRSGTTRIGKYILNHSFMIRVSSVSSRAAAQASSWRISSCNLLLFRAVSFGKPLFPSV